MDSKPLSLNQILYTFPFVLLNRVSFSGVVFVLASLLKFLLWIRQLSFQQFETFLCSCLTRLLFCNFCIFRQNSMLAKESLLSSPLPLINFRVFFQGKRHFRYEIRNFKAAATGGVPVYFSTRVNISLQLSIYQVRFESERFVFTLLQHFFPFHKLQTLFIHRQILIHLRHCDHDQQKTSVFFQSLLQLYFTEFSNPPVYYDLPPVYSWPMSFSQARLPIRKKHHCSLDFCADAPVNAIFHLEIIFK